MTIFDINSRYRLNATRGETRDTHYRTDIRQCHETAMGLPCTPLVRFHATRMELAWDRRHGTAKGLPRGCQDAAKGLP